MEQENLKKVQKSERVRCPSKGCTYETTLVYLTEHAFQLHKVRIVTADHNQVSIVVNDKGVQRQVAKVWLLETETLSADAANALANNKMSRDGLNVKLPESLILETDNPLFKPFGKMDSWSDEQVKALQEAIFFFREGYNAMGFTKSKYNHMVSLRMRFFSGVCVSAAQIKDKLHKMKNSYATHNAKNTSGSAGKGGKEPFFGYNFIHEIEGFSAKHQPVATVSNSSGLLKKLPEGTGEPDTENEEKEEGVQVDEAASNASPKTPKPAKIRFAEALECNVKELKRGNDTFEDFTNSVKMYMEFKKQKHADKMAAKAAKQDKN